jgi:CPA2 family monovalent cation:H+ antiporter-2
MLPERGRDLVLAGALLSIVLNPLFFVALDWVLARREQREAAAAPESVAEQPTREPITPTTLTGHVVLIGHGRVGSVVSAALRDADIPVLVVEFDTGRVERLRQDGLTVIEGNAADPEVAQAANLGAARCLIVAIPDAFEGGQVVDQARSAHPALPIIARAHSEEEVGHLKKHGASLVIMGEHEIARAMIAAVTAAQEKPPAPDTNPVA